MIDPLPLLCLIVYASIDLPRVATSFERIDDAQGTDKVAGWDKWLHDNSVVVNTVERPGEATGRVRAHAFGVSNPTTNFRSIAGAAFRHRFLLRRDQVMGSEEYRFDVTHKFGGRVLHTAAVPYPGDPRVPLAVTTSIVDWRIQALEVDPGGRCGRGSCWRVPMGAPNTSGG